MKRQRPGRSRSRGTTGARTLRRGLKLLTLLAQEGPRSLSDLARRSELDTSTTYRMLESLRQEGFAQREEARGLWRIGPRAYQVGLAYVQQGGLAVEALPELEALVDAFHETANLAVLDDHEAVYIQQVEGHHFMRMFIHIGARVPLHCAAVGKVLLAWQAPEDQQALLREPLPAFTAKSLTQPELVQAELAKVRLQGYALDDEELEPGVRCVAAPVWDWQGRVVAALSIAAPSARLPDSALPDVAKHVREAAKAISRRLGWQEVQPQVN